MSIELKVPQSGESISEVMIAKWRKSEGDRVEVDEVVVEIETDKAAIDLPAPVAGILSKILKKDGDEAAVGDVIGLIDESADGAGEAQKKDKGKKKGAKKELAAAAKPEKKAQETPPAAEKPAAQAPRVMPAAQRMLAQEGIDSREVKPSGPGGRILKEDVQRHLEVSKPAPEPREQQVALVADAPGESTREERIVAMSPMRKAIARNLVAAQQTAALLTTFNEVDMSEVIRLRKKHQEKFVERHGVKLGFMSFFVKAAVSALKVVPQVNAQIRDERLVFFNYQDVGVAVGGGKGLVVPLLRDAEGLSFAEIELKIADFAKRAQTGQIDLSELKGGTFTISNGGIYGSMLSTPIVNTPQSAILGLHAIQDRAVVVDGQVVVRPMMYLALTYDHRIVDGREAVLFLRHIKDVIEDPTGLLLEG